MREDVTRKKKKRANEIRPFEVAALKRVLIATFPVSVANIAINNMASLRRRLTENIAGKDRDLCIWNNRALHESSRVVFFVSNLDKKN